MPLEVKVRYPTAISQFHRGMIIRHKDGMNSYVVTDNLGYRAIAVRTIDICNPDEWEILDFNKTD